MTDRGDRTRGKLIRATTELVRDIGYSNVTTRGIARAAGVAEGTLYRHFPDKTALFFAAALDRHQEILAWVATLPGLAGQRDVITNLTQCLTRLAGLRADIVPLELAVLADPELARQHPGLRVAGPAVAGPAEAGPAEAGPSHAGLPQVLGPPEFLAAYLRAEQGLGRIRPDVDAAQAALVLLAALFGLAIAPGAPAADVDPALLEATVEFFLRGIGPVGGAAEDAVRPGVSPP